MKSSSPIGKTRVALLTALVVLSAATAAAVLRTGEEGKARRAKTHVGAPRDAEEAPKDPRPGISEAPSPAAGRRLDAIVERFGLRQARWKELSATSTDGLDERARALRTRFATLRSRGAAATVRHAQLQASQRSDEALSWVHTELLPLLEERSRLVGEMLLVLRAKHARTDPYPAVADTAPWAMAP